MHVATDSGKSCVPASASSKRPFRLLGRIVLHRGVGHCFDCDWVAHILNKTPVTTSDVTSERESGAELCATFLC